MGCPLGRSWHKYVGGQHEMYTEHGKSTALTAMMRTSADNTREIIYLFDLSQNQISLFDD